MSGTGGICEARLALGRRGARRALAAAAAAAACSAATAAAPFATAADLERGRICIIAGDISPIDVISHVPVLCEDNDVSYVFVTSKEALGAAGSTKRPTSVVLVQKQDAGDLLEAYNECREKTEGLK